MKMKMKNQYLKLYINKSINFQNNILYSHVTNLHIRKKGRSINFVSTSNKSFFRTVDASYERKLNDQISNHQKSITSMKSIGINNMTLVKKIIYHLTKYKSKLKKIIRTIDYFIEIEAKYSSGTDIFA